MTEFVIVQTSNAGEPEHCVVARGESIYRVIEQFESYVARTSPLDYRFEASVNLGNALVHGHTLFRVNNGLQDDVYAIADPRLYSSAV